MCGIVGIADLTGEPVSRALLARMTDSLAHRGPDGEGHLLSGPVALGHRRLAVIDLSENARQPLANEAGDVFITYNGEIYNFRELRDELERLGHRFRSRTDSEVALHAYEEWGEDAVGRFNGMFAFAIYDVRSGQAKPPFGRLLLARDRHGVKPVYYYFDGRTFVFASEIKAILLHPAVRHDVSYAALSEYFTFQNVLSDLTLFEGVRLLPPGTCLVVHPGDGAPLRTTTYWDFTYPGSGATLSFDEASDRLLELFEQAVTRQLVADVPVGAYLSGGLDSSSITAVARRQIPRIHTFTAGFDLSSASGMELAFDERRASEVMANTYKSEHYEVVLHAGDMEYVLPDLIWHLEDLRLGQCYPNYYVARLASKFVKVVLSGTGGDELFGGYPWRYYRTPSEDGGADYHRGYYDYWQRLVPDQDRAAFFNGETFRQVRGRPPFEAFRTVFPPDGCIRTVDEAINASLYFELKTFLHGLFVVEDKLSMAHSLETRLPFMDNDLVDFAISLPPSYKLRDLLRAPEIDENEPARRARYFGQPTADGKMILRRAMRHLIPAEILARAKQGFSAPDASWFRGASIDYVNGLLRDPRARIYDFLQPPYAARVLDEHCTGRVNHRLLIWSLLSFEWWLRRFFPA